MSNPENDKGIGRQKKHEKNSKWKNNTNRASSSAESSAAARPLSYKDGKRSDAPRGPVPLHASLFASSDPSTAIAHLISIESSSLLIKELYEGHGKGHKPFLDRLKDICDRESYVKADREKLASLLLQLLGRESFLEATQQEAVNGILEAIMPTKLFKPDVPNGMGQVLVSCSDVDFVSNLCRLLRSLLDRFPGKCILQFTKLFRAFPASNDTNPAFATLATLKARFIAMREAFLETGEEPKPVLLKFEKPPAMGTHDVRKFVLPGDPDAHTFAISPDAIPTQEETDHLQEELKIRTNPIVNSEVCGDVREYADTHWRLLRSDALSNILIGLQSYKAARSAYEKRISTLPPDAKLPWFQYPKHDSYYAYRKVKLQGIADRKTFGANTTSFLMSFVPISRGNRGVDWSVSKRLIPGSLLVLSSDHFKTLIWGTAGPRSDEYLKICHCAIDVNEKYINLIDASATYEMLETRALWVSYKPVLDRLNHFFEKPANFPLPDILIGQRDQNNAHVFPGTWQLKTIAKSGVTSQSLEPFLTWPEARLQEHFGHRHGVRRLEDHAAPVHPVVELQRAIQDLDLIQPPAAAAAAPAVENGPMVDQAAIVAADNAEARCRIAEFEEVIYPGANKTPLDTSQWAAMRMMLTQRVSIVQGPPGTGKTYIGLKAAEILLKQGGFQGPILCVCYTNHALDQFLGEILEFEKSVVRIGGRCKSEALAEYTLQKRRPQVRGGRTLYENMRVRDEYREAIQVAVASLTRPGRLLWTFWRWLGFAPVNRSGKDDLMLLYQLLDAPSPLEADISDKTHSASSSAPSASYEEAGVENAAEVIAEGENNGDSGSETSNEDVEEWLEAPNLGEENAEAVNEPNAAKNPKQKKENPVETEEAKRERLALEEFERFLSGAGTHAALELICKGGQFDETYLQPANRKFTFESFTALPTLTRKSVFKTWLESTTRQLLVKYHTLLRGFTESVKLINAFNDGTTVDFLKTQKVIGMTTTGAAKNAAILQALRPRVVIVEEAAEIFEAHVIACLTSSVEKLILIGDHQQLRPKVGHFPLTKRGLDISLFERLIMAGMPHVTLRQQHRMHPDISRFIKPIYPHLFDGPRTLENRLNFANFGLDSRVKFITHNWKEVGGGNEDEAASKSNPEEATYIYGLSRYLIAQGLDTSKLTIISMYQGQNRQLRKFFRNVPPKGFIELDYMREKLKEVRICCVDDYQGEENEVIIISLVRSNADGLAGFVRIANRVCVALSRARSMMFVVGSADTLTSDAKRILSKAKADIAEPPIWPPILELMQKHQVIGDKLTVCCPTHNDEASKKLISQPADWQQSISACSKTCNTQLECGHWCKQRCHGQMPHGRCYDPCEKLHPMCNHKCSHFCFQNCGDCEEMVSITLPMCGHVVKIKCQVLKDNPNYLPSCNHPCPRLHPCGHPCAKLCGQRCGDCYEVVETAKSPCGHILKNIPCHIASNRSKLAKQPHPCNHKLNCNHSCNGDCYTCQSTNQHKACTGKCGRSLPCTHACRGNCAEPCPPCLLQCPRSCAHGPCKHECGKRCNPCMDKCRWKCKHKACTQVCSDMCDRVGCEEACPEILKCGHPCVGLCGEICPKNCRICEPGTLVFSANFFQEPLNCDQDSKYIFLVGCGHLIEFGAMDHWMKSRKDDGIISLPTCPTCKSPISHTYGRYSNDVKEQLAFLDQVRARYRKDAIRSKFKEGDWHAVEKMIKSLFNVKPLGHSMEPPPRDIDMLLLLAVTKMKLYRDEGEVSVLVDEVLRREPDNAEAKEIEGSLLSKVIPTLARALANEVRVGGWYTCANGHPYAIGECGGAMEEAKCPCGASIGGRNHALRGDNRHYGAADGSRHAAYGDEANMANYQLDD